MLLKLVVVGVFVWHKQIGLYLKKQKFGTTMQSPEGLEDSPFGF